MIFDCRLAKRSDLKESFIPIVVKYIVSRYKKTENDFVRLSERDKVIPRYRLVPGSFFIPGFFIKLVL